MAKMKQRTIRIYDHATDKVVEVPESIAKHRLKWYHAKKGGTICEESEIQEYFDVNPQYQEAQQVEVITEEEKPESKEAIDKFGDMSDDELRQYADSINVKLGRTKSREKIIQKIQKAEQND